MLRQTFRAAVFVALPLTLSVGAPAARAAGLPQEIQQTIRVAGAGGDGGPISILPPGRQPKVGTGRLRGRVLAGDTGTPLRRAQVRVSSPDIGTKTALTDTQGRYEFRDLPAGRFNVSVSKSGFVAMQFGQNRPFEPGRPIELADAQFMDKADVALPRGSVLAGRVVDEFGEAVPEADVTAMRMQYQNGRRRLVPSGRNASSNDLGQFRIYGLPPGEYYVSATFRNTATMMLDMIGGSNAMLGPTGSNQTSGYASTYYPSTPNPAEAQRVALAVGQELPSVDIQLQPVRLAKITGTAMGSDGKPMSGAIVMLMPTMKDAIGLAPGGTSRTDKDGNFTLNSVTPGEYSLQVQSMGGVFETAGGGGTMMFSFRTSSDAPGAGSTSQQREFAMSSVNVSGEDISGLMLIGTRGAKASGTISFAGGMKPDGAANMRISAPAADADANPMPGLGGSNIKEGNSTFEFTLESLVGNRILRVANAPKGWALKSVKFNGEDVTDRGIEFKPGEDVAGLEIELTNKTQSIAGGVTTGSGEVAKDYTVVVFTDDQQKWVLPQNRWITSARPDQEGRFRIGNLPPGTYYAIAVDYVAQGEWQDPEWLARAAKKATRVTLEEGASKSLDLKIVAGS
jgi:protocatechuate 3,4-dioxygenase beta subunit